jgi:hypothetical protein
MASDPKNGPDASKLGVEQTDATNVQSGAGGGDAAAQPLSAAVPPAGGPPPVGATTAVAPPRSSLRRPILYWVGLAMLAVFGAVSFLPVWYPGTFPSGASVELFAQVVYVLCSLSIGLITFAVIGDSVGTFRFGGIIQLGGSAAGVAAFYFLLSTGLSQVQDRYLPIRNAAAKGDQLFTSDEIRRMRVIVGTPQMTQIVSTGEDSAIRFKMLKDADSMSIQVSTGDERVWYLSSVDPASCLKGRLLDRACRDPVALYFTPEACIKDRVIQIDFDQSDPLTLEQALNLLQTGLPVVSDAYRLTKLNNGIQMSSMRIPMIGMRANLCTHIREMELAANRGFVLGGKRVEIFASCSKILVNLQSEDPTANENRKSDVCGH